MAFAQPMALLFFLLFIPIILLYLLKQRRRRVQVSTLLFWDQILRDEQTVTSFTKLRKLLSLLLQLLFVTLLALALARPVFSADLLGARRIVVLLDASASMGVREKGGTRFDEAKRKAREVIDGLSIGDSLMLVAVTDSPDILVPFSDSRRELRDALDKVDQTDATGRFAGAFELLNHLPPDKRETYVYAITDGAFDPVETDVPERTRIAYLKTGTSEENVGVTSFQLRPLPASPRDFEILFEASNETKKEQRVPYELHVAGALVDAGEVVLPPGGRQVKTVRQFSREGGAVELVLDHADAFPQDNKAYAVLEPPEPIPVVLVTEANLFLESALLTDDGLAVQTLAPSAYPPAEGFDKVHPPVLIFDRWTPPATPPGNAIFIGAWPADLGVGTNGEIDKPIVTDWMHDHEVNRHLHLTNITIQKALKVAAPEGYEVLIRSFEDPLVLMRERPEGTNLLVAFDTTASDLPLRVAFPILIANAVRYMARETAEDDWQGPAIGQILTADEVGERISRHAAEEGATVVAVTPPGAAVPADRDRNQVEAAELAPVTVNRAGVYTALMSNGETAPLFAANLSSREETRIRPSKELPLKTAKPVPAIREGFRLGTDPWLLLVALALVLTSVEWFLFHRRWVE